MTDKINSAWEAIYELLYGYKDWKMSSEVTDLNIWNINVSVGDGLLLLSIPVSDNVVDLPDGNVVYSYYKNKILQSAGDKPIVDVINDFKLLL